MYAEQGLEYEDCGSVASRKAASLAEEVYFPLKILMDMIDFLCSDPHVLLTSLYLLLILQYKVAW